MIPWNIEYKKNYHLDQISLSFYPFLLVAVDEDWTVFLVTSAIDLSKSATGTDSASPLEEGVDGLVEVNDFSVDTGYLGGSVSSFDGSAGL